jgi:hypothetical protein
LVSNIKDVVWNYNVFNTLVLPNDTKELIKALVINKIAADERTDYFHGKGSGLVILFHGCVCSLPRSLRFMDAGADPYRPPGTGKTLTAER